MLRRIVEELPAGVPGEAIESLASEYVDHPEVVALGSHERTGAYYSTVVIEMCTSGRTVDVLVAASR